MADLGDTAGKAKDAFEEVKDLVKLLNESKKLLFH